MRFALLLILLLLTSCRSHGPSAQEDYYGSDVTLPNGKKILAESARTETMMMRGMMFRDSLAEVLEYFQSKTLKGEFVIVVGGKD